MKKLHRFTTLIALLMLLAAGGAVQAAVVSEGFKTGGWVVSGDITLDPGSYTLDLLVFTSGAAGPFIFGIANAAEAYQVSLGTFGSVSTPFTTIGGVFDFLVGGFAGIGAIYQASITPAAVPLPQSIVMLGTALAAMVSFARRTQTREASPS